MKIALQTALKIRKALGKFENNKFLLKEGEVGQSPFFIIGPANYISFDKLFKAVSINYKSIKDDKEYYYPSESDTYAIYVFFEDEINRNVFLHQPLESWLKKNKVDFDLESLITHSS